LDSEDIAALLKACHTDLADPDLWLVPEGYPNSLALCMIDAIYSGGAHHSSVVKVVGRYRDYRTSEGGNPDTDGADELARTIRRLGGPYAWATTIADHRPATTDGAVPSKAAAIVTLSKLLPRHWVRTTADLRSVADDRLALKAIERAWRALPGQGSGMTWEAALILAQVPGANAERLVRKYVTRVVGYRPGALDPAHAAHLLAGVAEAKAWNSSHLDRAIWRFESGRPYTPKQVAVTPTPVSPDPPHVQQPPTRPANVGRGRLLGGRGGTTACRYPV
jgi:hypothetical protein